MFVKASAQNHTPATVMPFLWELCATFRPIIIKSADDVAISVFCLFSVMVQGSPAIIHGWGLLCPHPPVQNLLASSWGIQWLFPYTSREAMDASLDIPKNRFLRHEWLLCGQSSLLSWWCGGIAEPSPLSHSAVCLLWLPPQHSPLHS